ncbi:tryptophan synthase subunit alpha [Caldilinea sp.]|jgi:tryptophan synthase alpha chain|uniref:tryptophan synthase subunit alpha n=1 Tax=Caldilinea sp. TaxID=2293560 RepID=UPI002632E948|nr:tryptophan synthase subunit alpha [uncultured Caldilinea sp.]
MTGLERIEAVFRRCRAEGRAAFMPYHAMGYPDRQKTLHIIRTLSEIGADLFEIGIPHSDPLADGPTIQTATYTALMQGTTVKDCLAMVRELRAMGVDQPFCAMSYYNPIFAYGVERFVEDAATAGVDGLIVPDLPPEEAGELEAACRQAGLATVYLLAPTSTEERIRYVASHCTGFIYLVSVTGITGARSELPPDLAEFVARVRRHTDLPLAVGFGIANGAQAAAVARIAEGVIVGSALVKAAGGEDGLARVAALGRELAHGAHHPRTNGAS